MRWTAPLIFLLFSAPLVGCDQGPLQKPTPQWAVSGLEGRDVQALKLRKDVLYAATDSGLYRRPLGSGHGGWAADGLQGKMVVDVTWRGDGALLAGVRYDDGERGPVLYKRGPSLEAEWVPFDEGYGPEDHRSVHALAAVPTARDTLFARGSMNVARSVDGGKHWTSAWSDWDQIGYQAPLLYVSPHNPSLVFAGGETSIFQPYLVRSPDAGATWHSPSGLPNEGDNAVYSMIEHPEEPGRFLLGMEGRVLRSEDGGRSWTTVYEPPQYTYVFDFAARREGNRTIVYAAGSENGTQGGRLTLHRTDDFGESWERIVYAEGPDATAIRALQRVKENGRIRLYLGTTVGVYVYTP